MTRGPLSAEKFGLTHPFENLPDTLHLDNKEKCSFFLNCLFFSCVDCEGCFWWKYEVSFLKKFNDSFEPIDHKCFHMLAEAHPLEQNFNIFSWKRLTITSRFHLCSYKVSLFNIIYSWKYKVTNSNSKLADTLGFQMPWHTDTLLVGSLTHSSKSKNRASNEPCKLNLCWEWKRDWFWINCKSF